MILKTSSVFSLWKERVLHSLPNRSRRHVLNGSVLLGFGVQGDFRVPCLFTQPSACADFTSHPPPVLAALSSKPSFHFLILVLILLSPIWQTSNTQRHAHDVTLRLPPCPPARLFIFSSSCCLCPSRPSSVASSSPPSFLEPWHFHPWLSWQPIVELIHELVLGQCKELLFVALDQLPGAELSTAGQWPFVV